MSISVADAEIPRLGGATHGLLVVMESRGITRVVGLGKKIVNLRTVQSCLISFRTVPGNDTTTPNSRFHNPL